MQRDINLRVSYLNETAGATTIRSFHSKWWTVMARRARRMAAARRRAVAGLAIERASRDLRGLVFLAIIAERYFGLRLGRRQWTGLLVTAIGLGVLGLTTAPIVRQHASAAALIAVEGAVLALSGVLIAVSSRLEPLDLRKGTVLGTDEVRR
jgi:hypothetical protein